MRGPVPLVTPRGKENMDFRDKEKRICSSTFNICEGEFQAVANHLFPNPSCDRANRKKEESQVFCRLLSNGEHLDDYVISNLISIGGFGQVYTGFHRSTNKRVAIKVESLMALIPLLRNEATCLKFLNSRHNPYGDKPREPILRYMTYGRTEKLRYLVMDHCGSNLRELKKATPEDKFSMTTSLWIMERMVSGIQFIHSHGWLHSGRAVLTTITKLFAATLQNVMRTLEWDNMGVKIDGRQIHHLRFADDIVLITPDISQAERMLTDFDEACAC
uniref:Protein kinase domain-containing protein n=1 Tax=Angiostrongylus cantonensis TaxID=6313 RepID=A0A0K0DLH7_ANGCA